MRGKIVILTGAGISAESGLGTFRDRDGIWSRYPLEEVATPQGFAFDPAKVHDFYNARRAQAASARPNAAHAALATLQRAWPGDVVIVTQNVDGLHEEAGAEALHMHGRLSAALCAVCDHRWPAPEVMSPGDACPSCGARRTRPDVVWFGEMPYHLPEIDAHLQDCALFAAIGTSGQVHPAAGFVEEAALAGARTVEINLEPSQIAGLFDETRIGPASRVVPHWVDALLAGPG